MALSPRRGESRKLRPEFCGHDLRLSCLYKYSDVNDMSGAKINPPNWISCLLSVSLCNHQARGCPQTNDAPNLAVRQSRIDLKSYLDRQLRSLFSMDFTPKNRSQQLKKAIATWRSRLDVSLAGTLMPYLGAEQVSGSAEPHLGRRGDGGC